MALNELGNVRARVVSQYTLELPDVDGTSIGTHVAFSGSVVQRRTPTRITHASLRDSQAAFSAQLSSAASSSSSSSSSSPAHIAAMHSLYSAWLHVRSSSGMPDQSLIAVANTSFALSKTGVDATWCSRIAALAHSTLPMLSSVVAGIATHELLKACTQRHTPISQWLYFDASSVIPNDFQAPSSVADASLASTLSQSSPPTLSLLGKSIETAVLLLSFVWKFFDEKKKKKTLVK